MSYDLMVFDPEAAPREREAFLRWYHEQVQWDEGHSYDDPRVTTPALASWFTEIAEAFPPINGPLASDDYDNPKLTDYSIGRSVIYAAFTWSQVEAAHLAAESLAAKHGVGFFDVSSDQGDIRFP
ncbi:hypothetical protein E2493_13205 [Sphingomonas parva]|uniref:Uncharacterized protein n=1 Tax=Sphingomonas parva TaxID=2555898 RepID=A0A4Y8ZP49_9SPHN|nr:hypothetical protein [Sphingomonas parva]TFI57781.1 hypothetical protein E2493_13205 [Sphingomonas parva]